MLACIAFRQPISQAEIDRLFDADKRGLVVKLRDLKLVEEFAGTDGRLRFATTEAFLQRFGLASLQELNAASLSGNPDKIPRPPRAGGAEGAARRAESSGVVVRVADWGELASVDSTGVAGIVLAATA